MESDVLAILREFETLTEEVAPLLILSRATFVIESVVARCTAILPRLAEVKSALALARFEDDANALLATECAARGIAEHARCLLSLKRDDGNAAWTHLVLAQGE